MLATVFMDKLMSMGMSLSVLIGVVVILFIALKSKSDGKELIKTVAIKRNLVIEIILFAMAIIEGFNAAGYALKEGRDYGAAIAMHVLGGALSGAFAFAISKQAIELTIAIQKKRHPFIIVKEAVDVVGSLALSVAAPALNAYFIAVAAKAPRDFWATATFDWGTTIHNASVMYSTGLGMLHVFGCFVLSIASLEVERLFENSNGGADDPLTQASDDDSEDADIDDDEAEIITTLPVPATFDPDKVDVENYLVENFQVDRQRLHHRLGVNPTFRREIKNLVTEALTHREEWETAKAILSEATRKIETNKTRMKRIEDNTYGFDPAVPGRVYTVLRSETEEYEKMTKDTKKDADLAEKNYNLALDAINDELSVI